MAKYINSKKNKTIVAEQAFVDVLINAADWVLEAAEITTLAENQTAKLKLNMKTAQQKIDKAFEFTPDFEVRTFDEQKAEYLKYQVDNTVATPKIDAILIVGETKADLIARIGANMAYVDSVQATMRQNYRDIKNATTQAELDAVVI